MVYMSLRENLFPPWSLNCVGQLSVQVYSDAHHQNVSVFHTEAKCSRISGNTPFGKNLLVGYLIF